MTIPARAGAGFRSPHAATILERRPDVAWFEIHPENYMVDGGPRLEVLEKLRENYPISFHGLALSLAGFERPDKTHLRTLKLLIERFEPALISEHVAWSAFDGHYFADLLPFPFSKQALDCLVRNVREVQDYLGRRILIENPAQYLALPGQETTELEFITEAARQSGSGMLFDVTNLFITQQNLGTNARTYIDTLDPSLIGEVHLAGFSHEHFLGKDILIDSHCNIVPAEVWALFKRVLRRTGPIPALVEWDNDLPAWPVLEAEVQKAQEILDSRRAAA